MDLFKKYRASYVVESGESFLKWIVDSLKEAKNISNNENFEKFLIPQNNAPFLCILDNYKGMPYTLTFGTSFAENNTFFLIEVFYQEK